MLLRLFTLTLICLFSYAAETLAQDPGDIFDTVYYDKYNYKIKAKYGVFYREPAKKEGSHYIATWRLMDGTPLFTCSYLAVLIDYHLSIEDGVGYKDGPIIAYAKDHIAYVGEFRKNEPVGTWRYFYEGTDQQRNVIIYDSSGNSYHTIRFTKEGKKLMDGNYKKLIRSGNPNRTVWTGSMWKRMPYTKSDFYPHGTFIFYFSDTQSPKLF